MTKNYKRRNRNKFDKRDAERDTVDRNPDRSERNDPSFYYLTPERLTAVATFPFNLPSGTNLQLWDDYPGAQEVDHIQRLYSLPGICVLSMAPTIGEANDAAAAANMAFMTEFAYNRSKTSATKQYNATDMGVCQIAVREAFSYLNWMRRAYGIMNNYNPENRYLPVALLQAMGIDPTSVIGHQLEFYSVIADFTHKLRSFAVPADLKFLAKGWWIYENVYTDGGVSPKSQLYFYNPEYFYKYSSASSQTGGSLVPKYMPNFRPGMTINDMRAFGADLLDQLLEDTDIGIIMGDIRKAYDGRLITAPETPIDYAIDIKLDVNVLLAIHNADIVTFTDPKIEQVIPSAATPDLHPYLVQKGDIYGTYAGWKSKKLLDIPSILTGKIYPSPENVIEATRYTFIANGESLSGNQYKLTGHYGDYLCVGAYIWQYVLDDMSGNRELNYVSLSSQVELSSTGTNTVALNSWLKSSKFGFAPICRVNNSASTPCDFMGTIDVYHVLDEHELANLHREAILGLFNI